MPLTRTRRSSVLRSAYRLSISDHALECRTWSRREPDADAIPRDRTGVNRSCLTRRGCRILSARTAEPEYVAITEASAAERGSRFETQASTPYRRRADGHPSFIGEYIDQFGQLCPFRRCDPHVLERTRRIT